MKHFHRGSPVFGLFLGLLLALLGALVMTIGFWKTLIFEYFPFFLFQKICG